ncbi:hypothetical protein [Porphyromonas catoniae]|jgi:hypothetical protein|nr:hypothetical protein [Porphyromonas catoniae]DAV05698.1 MAG TPA: hypothetical protein [Caudoviricetes sp.]
MRRQIEINDTLRKELMQIFGVSTQWIGRALRYESEAESAERIRRISLDRGGKLCIIAVEDEVFEDRGNLLLQTYANGAILELDKVTGDARILQGGKVCAIHPNVEVSRLRSLQQLAREL